MRIYGYQQAWHFEEGGMFMIDSISIYEMSGKYFVVGLSHGGHVRYTKDFETIEQAEKHADELAEKLGF